MLKALMFDVDGTLADTEVAHLEAFNHAFPQVGLDWHWSHEDYADLLEISGGKERLRHFWHVTHPDMTDVGGGALDDTLNRLHEIKTAYYENAVNEGRVHLRPGVLDLINAAHAEGVQLAIATTTSPVNVAALLRKAIGNDWRTMFVAVGDGSSSPVKKPNPQVYLQLLGDMSVPAADCVAFEDSPNGLRAAMAAGLQTVITPTEFSAHRQFDGALRVLPNLSGVTVAQLREWLAQAAPLPPAR
jgi:beta-phosphoglucomutase-like phosphatase (HAD superfamily)